MGKSGWYAFRERGVARSPVGDTVSGHVHGTSHSGWWVGGENSFHRTRDRMLMDVGALTLRLDHLHALLRRLNLQRETILPYTSPDSKEQPMTLDRYLDLLDRQHYLEKVGPFGC